MHEFGVLSTTSKVDPHISMIDDATKRALFNDIHRDIAEISAKTVERIPESITDLVYPPNAEFTPEERAALQQLQLSKDARSGLQKLVAEACSGVMFGFFALTDGVADPSTGDFPVWLGVSLTPKPDEDEPMLHDEFYSSYWDYKEEFTIPSTPVF